MKSIYKREMKSYFTSYLGYIFISFILLATGIYSWYINFLNQSPKFEYIIYNLNFIYLIIIPIITMHIIAEERRQKTDKLLYSLPLKSTQIIIGKFAALVTLLFIPLIIISIYPLILSLFGTISLLTCYSTIMGFYLLGICLISIGIFISSLSDNQFVAASITFVIIFIAYLSPTIANGISTTAFASFAAIGIISIIISILFGLFTKKVSFGMIIATILLSIDTLIYIFYPTLLEGAIQKVLNSISLFDYLYYFVNGIFDITAIVYYISLTTLFVFFTVQAFEKRRWS